MKKITLTLLSILMLVALFSCGENECAHTYDNACDTDCNECAEERTVNHVWMNATCTAPKTCKLCGKTEGNANGHESDIDDGDCTTPVCCTVCGTETVRAMYEHNFISELTKAAENTYVQSGSCDACGTASPNTTLIVNTSSSYSLTELTGKYNSWVFLFTHDSDTYEFKLDANGNEDVELTMYFFTDETVDGYFGFKDGHSVIDGAMFLLENSYIGITLENHSDEDATVTLTLMLQQQ